MSETLPDSPETPEAALPNPDTLTKTIFVKRSNGEVSTMRIAENAKGDEAGKLRAYLVENDEEDGTEFVAGFKPISEFALSDDIQAALGAEYAAKNSVEQQVEKESLTEEQEELADEAIEKAIGLEDPSEIDEDAHNYSLSDIQKMREEAALRQAAERVLDTPAMITSEEVQAVMSKSSEAAAPTQAAEAATDPADVLRKLTEGLSADDLLELRSYAEATDEVREAQKEGRGKESTYWQQIKGQSFRAMSARAQSVAIRYAGYYNLTK